MKLPVLEKSSDTSPWYAEGLKFTCSQCGNCCTGGPGYVWISKGDRRVNAKSIMGVMMLAAGIGSEVEIETSGDREQEALDAIVALIGDKFGEGE